MTTQLRDLILVNRNNKLVGYLSSRPLAGCFQAGEEVRMFNDVFQIKEPICEWLEVVETSSHLPIGVALLDFYSADEDESVLGLRAENVIWNEDRIATFLFRKVESWETSGGPYLPAYLLSGARGSTCYFIPECVPADCGADLPDLDIELSSTRRP